MDRRPTEYKFRAKTTVLRHITPLDYDVLSHSSPDRNKDFRAQYWVGVTDETTTLYRVHNNADPEVARSGAQKLGAYYTAENPAGRDEAYFRTTYAVQPEFNKLTHTYKIQIPPGIVVFEGVVAPQGSLMGDGFQYYIPHEIIKAIHEKKPLSEIYRLQKAYLSNWEQKQHIPGSFITGFLDATGKATTTNRFDKGSGKPPNNPGGPGNGGGGGCRIPISNTTAASSPMFSSSPATCLQQTRGYSSQTPSSAATSQQYQATAAFNSSFQASAGISSSQTHMSSPWPGGVELISPIPITCFCQKRRVTENKITIRRLTATYVELAAADGCRYKLDLALPYAVTADEFTVLDVASRESTREGVMLSMRFRQTFISVTTDGIDYDLPGADTVKKHLQEADTLLSNLIFGHDMLTNELTRCDVDSYQNPLEYCGGAKCIDEQERQNLENFSHIEPYPKFTTNPDAYFTIEDNRLVCHKCPVTVAVRGYYVDPLGTYYYDDDGVRCFANKPFVSDFSKRYAAYGEAYQAFAALQSYAIIVGLMLNIERKPKRQIHKELIIERELPEPSAEYLQLRRQLSQRHANVVRNSTNNNQLRTIQLLNLVGDYMEHDALQVLAREILARGKEQIPGEHAEFLWKILTRNSLAVLATLSMGKSESTLCSEDKNFYANLLGIQSLPDAKFCTAEEAISIRSAELCLHISVEQDAFDTSYPSDMARCILTLTDQILQKHATEADSTCALSTAVAEQLTAGTFKNIVGPIIRLVRKLMEASNDHAPAEETGKGNGDNAPKVNDIDDREAASKNSTQVKEDSAFTRKLVEEFTELKADDDTADGKLLENYANYGARGFFAMIATVALPRKLVEEFTEIEKLKVICLSGALLPRIWLKQLTNDKTKMTSSFANRLPAELYKQFSDLMRSINAAVYLASVDQDARGRQCWLRIALESAKYLEVLLLFMKACYIRRRAEVLHAELANQMKSLKTIRDQHRGRKVKPVIDQAHAVMKVVWDFRSLENVGSKDLIFTSELMINIYENVLEDNYNAMMWRHTLQIEKLNQSQA